MKKKLKKIAIIIFVIGLILIFYGIINFKDNNKEIETSKENAYINLYNFYSKTKEKNLLEISFNILNTSENTLNDQIIYLNFYQDNKLLYTYEYEIIELDYNNSIDVQSFIEFEFDNIDKYELVVNDIKKEIVPYN